jgi:OmpA-OmpF porin, OOP family
MSAGGSIMAPHKMKNSFKVACLFFSLPAVWHAQSAEHKWNVGIHGGAYQYNGELGNGFYDFSQAYYGLAGVSVSRYLSRHFDATVFATRGEVGYGNRSETFVADGASPRNFLSRLTTINAMIRFFPIGRTRYVQPYLTAGVGAMFQRGINDNTTYVNRSPFDFSMPAVGAGLQFPLGRYVAIQLQETFIYGSADQVDRIDGGLNDMYVLHSLGVTINLFKFWKKSAYLSDGENGGKDVDKCMKMPKELESKKNSNKKKEGRKGKRKRNKGAGN